jgi:cell wall assembly regulator SMI1
VGVESGEGRGQGVAVRGPTGLEFEIERSNQFGPLDIFRLAAFEQVIGARLPDSYRDFLITHNGGNPKGARKLCRIHHVHGIHDGPDWARFPQDKTSRVSQEVYSKLLPPRMLPIADDPGGNLYCISLGGPDRGTVFRWHHERARDKDAFQWISDDFSTFLEGMAWLVAISNNDLAAVKSAIGRGVDVDRKFWGKDTLFDIAVEAGRFEIQTVLADAGATIPASAILEATRSANLNAIQFLVARGLAVDYADPETGFTPLMMAASGDAVAVAKYLLEKGADSNAVNKWKKRAKDLAHSEEMRDLLA